MVRFLTGMFLAQLNLLLLLSMLAMGLRAWEAASVRMDLQATTHELKVAEYKHCQLIRQIQIEGLHRRLGLPGQPWLACNPLAKS